MQLINELNMLTFEFLEKLTKLFNDTSFVFVGDNESETKKIEKLQKLIESCSKENANEFSKKQIPHLKKQIETLNNFGSIKTNTISFNNGQETILLTPQDLKTLLGSVDALHSDACRNENVKNTLIKFFELNFKNIYDSNVQNDLDKVYGFEYDENIRKVFNTLSKNDAKITKDESLQNFTDTLVSIVKLNPQDHLYRNFDQKFIATIHTFFDNFKDASLYFKTLDFNNIVDLVYSWCESASLLNKLPQDDKSFWKSIIKFASQKGLQLLNLTEYLNDFKEFKDIVCIKDSKPEERISQIDKLIQLKIFVEYIFSKTSKNNIELTSDVSYLIEQSIKYSLSLKVLETCIDLLSKKKESDLLPNIKFDFQYKEGKYSFEKLKPSHLDGLFLGKMTGCCQFIGGHSEQCVIDGFTKSTASFYVIKNNGKIVAQSYAFMVDKGIVLDSFEYLDEAKNTLGLFIKPLVEKLQAQNLSLYLGVGGRTPKLFDCETVKRPEPTDKSLHLYGDSNQVYKIPQDGSIGLVNQSQEISTNKNLSKFDGFQQYSDVF